MRKGFNGLSGLVQEHLTIKAPSEQVYLLISEKLNYCIGVLVDLCYATCV